MMKEKRYIERDDIKNATHLEISVYYSKGGVNCFSDQVASRGYYLSYSSHQKQTALYIHGTHSGCFI